MSTPLTGAVPPLTDTELVQAAPYVFGLLDGAIATIADLRAVLAPLLDEPFEGDTGEFWCRFCEHSLGPEWDPVDLVMGSGRYIERDAHLFVHKPSCPVLRKDELLGR